YDGFIDESQLMFYKGSYFVQVFSSGKGLADSRYLYACGSTIDKNIIGERQPPKELSFIDIPGIIHGSERYYVKGLFGNAFFQKGIVAQTTKKGPGAQVFIVIGDSTQAIMENCERYTKHLETSGIDYLYKKEPDGITLMVKDPLHKVMFVKQKGRYLIGTSKIEDEADAWSLINMIKSRVP
ncbi:MAG: hypothetical protein N3D15_04520, partial [Syntrophorhabdaceae bacterium]|nr:hypothetical protein [Syntrophorhabdaceae bacterium]